MTKKARADTSGLTRVVFRLPAGMQRDLAVEVAKSGYGLRGKSRWVNEAILHYLNDVAWFDQIEADRQGERDANEEVRLDNQSLTAINKATKIIQAKRPIFSSPRSTIIRCAIHYQLTGLDTHTFRDFFKSVSPGD